MMLHKEKNGLIILVEIGVFVLRRKKMGQLWAGINSYNKAPQVPKDEKKLKLCWEMGCQ